MDLYKKLYKSRYIYIAIVLISGILVMAFSINRLLERQAIKNLSLSLSAILASTHEAMSEWSENHIWQTQLIASNPEFVN